jgi:predicted SAM-dependent methyltransferase
MRLRPKWVPASVWNIAKVVRLETFMLASHVQGLMASRRYAGKKGLRLNIGCGSNIKPGWVNIDMSARADLSLDMRERFPFADVSADIVYSEHFFEHLDYPIDTGHFLSESFRVLVPGGVFSVGVPDTKWPLLEYAGVQSGYLEAARNRNWHPEWSRGTLLARINYHFRQEGEHRFAWDFETLEQALSDAGFVEIRERKYNPDLDTEDRSLGTLYVEAAKPNPA